ncbi:MAG: hypothetical protein MJZ30_11610 [Paludibacteraceae bacterium]|nr:hypothetical protein [Paludibacteraceae bacterium]
MTIWESRLAQTFVESAIKFFNSERKIDWEQRRYEIAREIYANNPDTYAEQAVKLADDLIAELKK